MYKNNLTQIVDLIASEWKVVKIETVSLQVNKYRLVKVKMWRYLHSLALKSLPVTEEGCDYIEFMFLRGIIMFLSTFCCLLRLHVLNCQIV